MEKLGFKLVVGMTLGFAVIVAVGLVASLPTLTLAYLGVRHVPPVVAGVLDWGFLFTVVVLVVRWRRRRARGGVAATGAASGTSHGSAVWGSGEALRGPSAGLILGRLASARGRGTDLLRLGGEGHVLTLAPTGAGKGVSAVIPNLLTHSGSLLVTDPKGENFAVSSRRRAELGQRVLALDPFSVVGGTASFNPLETLEPEGLDAVDDAMRIAELLVIETGRESADSAFWNEECKALLAGLVLHVASTETGARRSLATVWELLSLPSRELTKLWYAMGKSEAAHGAVARAAARVRQKADRVRSGILAQAQSHTHFLESPRLAHALASSSFQFEDLKRQRVTLYLVVPPDRLDVARRWLRLMVGCAVHALTKAPGLPAERVLMLLDEFPSLGRLRPVEQAIALARGYGATLWLLAQDFSQLQATYPTSWRSFYAGADVLQAFGANDFDTADYLSRLTGEATIRVGTSSQTKGTSHQPFAFFGGSHDGTSDSVTERGRRLLTADEVRRLPRDKALVFVRGQDPLLVDRVNYLADREFRGLFDANPMHAAMARANGS